jgi:excisionase family DNA binding protein
MSHAPAKDEKAIESGQPRTREDAPPLAPVLARDQSAWRVFVDYYDPRLRAVVDHANEASSERLSSDAIDDVMGDFWRSVFADDMRMLRKFDPKRGAALLTWMTFHVAQFAYEYIRQAEEAPEFVPLHEARNVPAPEPMTVDQAIRAAVRDAITDELRKAVKPVVQEKPVAVASEYLSADQAAAVAGVRAATVREWISQGKLQGHRAGRLLRIRRDELERFLAGASTTPGVPDLEVRRRKALARLK